ncbi:lipocalin family protein [Muricauda sp. 334s03]|uniref:Lipocalin family protein n=1 Tax=Flagellimonas yonaguniensis TaxID=3031325 RepID=A0ABT5Y2M4_9FLAO|nr:lipocalin family protein [[Muricauda] yonaguniensis]MDF0717701.1 lipocalin family protein [[Muricauda] yonaguniensis]
MKNKKNTLSLFATLVLVLLFSCSSDDGKNQVDNLIGVWQMIERHEGGSPEPFQRVKNGKTIVFSEDGTFTDSFLESCRYTYSLRDDIITIQSPCDPENKQYRFGLENGHLRLTAIPNTCDEGCYDIYKRI